MGLQLQSKTVVNYFTNSPLRSSSSGCGAGLTYELVVKGQARVGSLEALLLCDCRQVPKVLVAPAVQLCQAGSSSPLYPNPRTVSEGKGKADAVRRVKDTLIKRDVLSPRCLGPFHFRIVNSDRAKDCVRI